MDYRMTPAMRAVRAMSTSCISTGMSTLFENNNISLIRAHWVRCTLRPLHLIEKLVRRRCRVVYPCLAVVGERPVVRRFKSCMFSSNHLAGHCIYVSAASGVRCSPW
jgi:hypothetical protein